MRDDLSDRPAAVAVGAVQVSVADRVQRTFQPVEGAVQSGARSAGEKVAAVIVDPCLSWWRPWSVAAGVR